MSTFNPISKIDDKDRYERIMNTLITSVYPGAKHESAEMVIEYCNHLKLDPMMKPVHIVPMSVRDSKTGDFIYRDVIMPGIGLYRILASRNPYYLSISQPTFGPNITEVLGGVEITYPEWCLIYVKIKRFGEVVEIPSVVYWKEAYATAPSKKGVPKTTAPNSMWFKRPRGQLAKCTEANGYRTALPDTIGSMITYEEIEGKMELSKDLIVLNDPIIGGNDKLKKVIDFMPENTPDTLSMDHFIVKIDSSKSKEELYEISNNIKKHDFKEEEKEKLRNFFAGRLEQMKKFNSRSIKKEQEINYDVALSEIGKMKSTVRENNS